MTLTEEEKWEIVEMIDAMDRSEIEAILRTQDSFATWLKKAAIWIFQRIAEVVIGKIVNWLWILFFC